MIIRFGICFIVIGLGTAPFFLAELSSPFGRLIGMIGLLLNIFIIGTGISLLLKKNWARIAAQVILSLFVLLGISLVVIFFLPSHAHHPTKPMTLELIVSMVIVFLLGVGLPVWGMIILGREDVKKVFLSGEALLASPVEDLGVSIDRKIDLQFLESDPLGVGKMCRSSFVVQGDGQVVFSLGPLRQAYVVDSSATAERLYNKYALYYYWFLAVTLFVIVLFGSKLAATPRLFIGVMAGMLLFQNILLMTLFSKEFGRLQKVEKKNPIGMWLTGMGQGLSRKDILIRLGGSAAFVLASQWMMKTIKGSEVISWSSIVIFTVAALVWLTILLMKKNDE
ncbi:MAG: hypothetical protein HQL22_09690 [Candidatus Omnitrophica bacterium]|nr:hypothetical protein [Candidatus Omnitrophota bacterium]